MLGKLQEYETFHLSICLRLTGAMACLAGYDICESVMGGPSACPLIKHYPPSSQFGKKDESYALRDRVSHCYLVLLASAYS